MVHIAVFAPELSVRPQDIHNVAVLQRLELINRAIDPDGSGARSGVAPESSIPIDNVLLLNDGAHSAPGRHEGSCPKRYDERYGERELSSVHRDLLPLCVYSRTLRCCGPHVHTSRVAGASPASVWPGWERRYHPDRRATCKCDAICLQFACKCL